MFPPEALGCQIKIPEPPEGYLFLSYFLQTLKTRQAIATTLACSLELDDEIILLKKPHTWL